MSDAAASELVRLSDDQLDALAERLAPLVAALLAPAEGRTVDALLTPQEAARRARAHVETIRRAVRSGALPAKRVGRGVRIATDDLDAWLTRSTATPATSARARRSAGNRRPLTDALHKPASRC